MQPVERKRQGYIHELIQTEERYMDDLQLVIEVRAVAYCLLREREGGHLCPSHLGAMEANFFCFVVLGMKPHPVLPLSLILRPCASQT